MGAPGTIPYVGKGCAWDCASEKRRKQNTTDLEGKKIAVVTGQRGCVFVGLCRNIFVSEMGLTWECVKVNYLSDDWRRFMQYSAIEQRY